MSIQNASIEVDQKARAYAANHAGVNYGDAVRQVLRDDTDLARRYEGATASSNTVTQDSQALDHAAREYQNEHPGVDYTSACKAVIRESEERHADKVKEADRRSRAYLAEWPSLRTYESAQTKVFADDPALAADGGGDANMRAIQRLIAYVGGLPRHAAGTISIDDAVRLVSDYYSELASRAAGDWLTDRAVSLASATVQQGEPTADNKFSGALTEIRRQNPSVDALYSRGILSAEALTTICWPLRFV